MQSLQTDKNKLAAYVSDLQSGSRPKGGVRGIASGIPSIGGEHINSYGGFNFSSIKYVPFKFADLMTKGNVKQNDILMVKDGATTGKVAFVDKSFPFEKATVNEHVFIIRVTNNILPKFLFWFLWSEIGQREILNNFQGSAQGGINRSFIDGVDIPYFPIEEQELIINKFENMIPHTWTDKTNLTNAKQKIKKFRQAVLSAAITGKLTEDWRSKQAEYKKIVGTQEDITAADDFQDIDLPENWVWTRLGKVADVKGGVTKGRNLNGRKTISLPYLRVANVQDGFLDLSEIKEIDIPIEETDKYKLEAGDILFTEGGDRDKLGRGTVWKGEIDDCIHQNHIFRARLSNEEILPEFISIFTKSKYARDYFFNNASQTVNLASINSSMLKNIPICLPNYAEQIEITKRVSMFFNIADQVEKQIGNAQKKVEKLTQAILAKTFSAYE